MKSEIPRGLNDQRVPIAPAIPVASEQPHALALALDDQAVAVVFDFVDPVGPRRNLGSAGRDARCERNFTYRPDIGIQGEFANL